MRPYFTQPLDDSSMFKDITARCKDIRKADPDDLRCLISLAGTEIDYWQDFIDEIKTELKRRKV